MGGQGESGEEVERGVERNGREGWDAGIEGFASPASARGCDKARFDWL